MKKIIFTIVPTFILIMLDQVSKYIVIHSLKINGEISLIHDIFHLQYLENRGAAFGMLQNRIVFLIAISIIIATILFIGLYKIPFQPRYYLLLITLVLIGSGAIGNMVDRVFRGYVVDFLYFKLINFPIFNIADCYVVIGAFLAIFSLLFVYKDEDINKIFQKSAEEMKKDE